MLRYRADLNELTSLRREGGSSGSLVDLHPAQPGQRAPGGRVRSLRSGDAVDPLGGRGTTGQEVRAHSTFALDVK
jgi:hypothetical protein